MTTEQKTDAIETNALIAAPDAPTPPDASELADRMAVVLVDGGAPRAVPEVKKFLKRSFADPRVFDSPLGEFALSLFTAIFRPFAARDLTRALQAVGGQDDLADQLKKGASGVCKALCAMGGIPSCEPFGAALFSSPSLPKTLNWIQEGDFSQVVAIWPHPFESSLTKSVRELLLKYASHNPKAPPMAWVTKWMDPDVTVELICEVVSQALASLPEEKRSSAHIAFILQPLPIEGKLDHGLFEARKLTALAMEKAQATNDFSVVYLEGLEPASPMIPDFDDLLRRLSKHKPQLICVPLMSLVEDLSLKAGLKVLANESAQKKGFQPLMVTPSPFMSPRASSMVARSVVEQLQRANEFSRDSFVRPTKNSKG